MQDLKKEKNMKKRISIFVLALLLLPCIFMLSACGGNDNKSNNSSQSQKYSITFIVDEEIYAKIETSGNEYIQLPTSPTKDYYDFVGWYDDSDNLFETINTQQCENISLTAKFTPTVYTISYELNGGTNDSSNPTTYTVETPTITLQPATFENETVSRWYSEQAFETRITTIPKGSHGNITLYARAGYDDSELFVIENNVLTGMKKSLIDEFDITKIVIPNDIAKISSDALNSVTSIGNYTFSDCSGLSSLKVEEGNEKYHSAGNCIIETNSKTLIVGCKTSIIPNDGSVTNIGNYAFSGCSGLTSIIIPDSVTNIEKGAFYGCSSLDEITIPFVGGSPTKNAYLGYIFGASSYSDNSEYVPSSLKKIDITGGTEISEYAFSYCSGLITITIPDSVTSIGSSAFSGCGRLTTITIPDSVTSIDGYTFSGCSSLTSITIPDSVTSIGNYAFFGCSSLTSITIPDSVTSIGGWAFYSCDDLTSIIIPNNVTSISGYAFYSCRNLTIYCEQTSQPTDWSSYWNYSNRPVYLYSETEPTTSGNYWHYVDGVVTKWGVS